VIQITEILLEDGYSAIIEGWNRNGKGPKSGFLFH
jgi:hypothetical protein